MPGITSSLNSSAQALDAVQQAITTVQNNIVNSSTPGYAAVTSSFIARSFDPRGGYAGGVDITYSSNRNTSLDQAVRRENSSLANLQSQNPLLNSLQAAFSVSGDSGVPGALTSFAQSFATLSDSANDGAAQAGVLRSATTLAAAFNQTAARLGQVSGDSAQQAIDTVNQINQLGGQIASINSKIQQGANGDAGLDAQLNSALDSLSQLVNISVTHNADGTAAASIGGQTPLVLGSSLLPISIAPVSAANPTYPTGQPALRLFDPNGQDITVQASGGQLGGLLNIHNQVVPRYLGDQNQPGQLNTLAKTFADRVNQVLTNGQISAGPPAAPGVPLFTYSGVSNTSAAASLAVNPAITSSQIATISPGPPSIANGVAVELSTIDNSNNGADQISGQSFTSFYGQLAGQAGAAASQSATDLQSQQDVTAQAESQRTQVSGVSLNQQAALLLNLQEAYQATARLISVLNNLSQSEINIVPQA